MDLFCTEQVNLNDCSESAAVYLSGNSSSNGNSNKVAAAATTTVYAAAANQPQQRQQQSFTSPTPATATDNNSIRHSYSSSNVAAFPQNFSNSNHTNTAIVDPTFLADRCLENLLKTEERYTTNCSYFKTLQKDITPPMRRIVVEWMMEVCEEEKCQEEVVLLALNYMDRFLATTIVRKTYLQILAAACLLLASKLREPSCRGLSAELLVFYTDNSILKQDLIHWELYVLSRLKWDVSAVTPLDFLELLLIRVPISNSKCPDLNPDKIRQHAQAFISLAAKEHYFSSYSPSTIAASSIAAALSGLNWHLRTGIELKFLLNRLTDLTGVEQDYLRECMLKMEEIFEQHSQSLRPSMYNTMDTHQQQQQQQQQQSVGSNNCNNNNNNNCNTDSILSVTDSQSLNESETNEKCKVEPAGGTPTDVQDVQF